MRSFDRTVIPILFCVLALASCHMLDPQISSDPVSGHIAGNPFTFVSGYAGPSATDAGIWIVYLYHEAPATGTDPWDTGAYTEVYPYVDFSFDSSLVPGEFSVSTYAGIADGENIGIYGWLTFFDNILFDSGTLIIDEFDLVSGRVSGRIQADTRDESSKINGSFEVSIDPADL